MARIFADFKESASQVSAYLKTLKEDDIALICRSVDQDSWPAGADLARQLLERYMAKMRWSWPGTVSSCPSKGWIPVRTRDEPRNVFL